MTENMDASDEATKMALYREKRDLLFTIDEEGLSLAPASALIQTFISDVIGGDSESLKEKNDGTERIYVARFCELYPKKSNSELKLTKEQWELPERIFYILLAVCKPEDISKGGDLYFLHRTGFKPGFIDEYFASLNHNLASPREPGFVSLKNTLTYLISTETNPTLREYYTLAQGGLNEEVQIPEANWNNLMRQGILNPASIENPLHALQLLLVWATDKNKEWSMPGHKKISRRKRSRRKEK